MLLLDNIIRNAVRFLSIVKESWFDLMLLSSNINCWRYIWNSKLLFKLFVIWSWTEDIDRSTGWYNWIIIPTLMWRDWMSWRIIYQATAWGKIVLKNLRSRCRMNKIFRKKLMGRNLLSRSRGWSNIIFNIIIFYF